MVSIIVGLIFGFGTASFQEPTEPPKNPYKPTKETLKYDEVTQLDVTYSMEFRGKRPFFHWECDCINKCQGKKHIRHEDCDLSCDTKCQLKHELSSQPEGIYNPDASTIKEISAAFAKVGSPLGSEWQQKGLMPDFEPKFEEILKKIGESDKYTWKKRFPHWNNFPCSYLAKNFDIEDWYLVAEWQVFRIDKAADGREIRVAGPKGKLPFAYIYLINADSEKNDNPRELCRCKVVMTEKEEKFLKYVDEFEAKKKKQKEEGGNTGEKPPTGGNSGKPDIPKEDKPGGGDEKAPEPALPKDGKVGMELFPKDLEQCNFEVVCNSMSEAVCTGTNPYSFPIEVEIPPGTLCVPEDSSYQTCQFATRCRIAMPANSTVSFPVRFSSGPFVDFSPFGFSTARISCLEMLKKEPEAKVKFRLDANYDFRLIRLAEKIDRESFRGPNDQVRIWIATDKATYQDIEKHLLPAPGGGTYLRLVYEVNRITGIDFEEPEYQKCLDPMLLTEGGNFDGLAARWCVQKMIETKPNQLVTVLKKNSPNFLTLLDKGESERRRFAEIFGAMLTSQNANLTMEAINFLLSIVPDTKLRLVQKYGGLRGLSFALIAPDEGVVKATINLAVKAQDSVVLPTLYLLKINSPSNEIRQMAEMAIGSITKRSEIKLLN